MQSTDQKVGGSSPSERAQLTGPLPARQRAFLSLWEPRAHVSRRTTPGSSTQPPPACHLQEARILGLAVELREVQLLGSHVYITHICQPWTARLGQPRDKGRVRGWPAQYPGVPLHRQGHPKIISNRFAEMI